jgi:hypothetical protein
MERVRTVFTIPDAINCSKTKGYTQIPDEVLRNPKISAVSTKILGILLSNKEGWKSYLTTLNSMMKEGLHSIKGGLTELETLGYLKRFRYRDINTKQMVGSFWAYADTPLKFKIKSTKKLLRSKGLEVIIPQPENPQPGIPGPGKPTTNNINSKNTKEQNNFASFTGSGEEDTNISWDGNLHNSMFDTFWELYPRKTNKGKAKTSWEKLCKKGKNAPKWRVVERAIRLQKNTEQWIKENGQWIPYPATWLNNNGWLDTPSTMGSFNERKKQGEVDAYEERELDPKFRTRELREEDL